MSVYDENAILKDMLLVNEALEEVEETIQHVVNNNYPGKYSGVDRHSGKPIGRIGKDVKKRGVERDYKEENIDPARRASWQSRRKSSHASDMGNYDGAKYHDVAYKAYRSMMKESFEDIYNSIL